MIARRALRRGLFAALVAGAALAGCAVSERLRAERALEPGDAYVRALDEATRQTEHLEDFTVHTHAKATLFTPAFREAFAAEYAAVYGPARKAPGIADDRLTLVVALATNERELNDLSSFGRLWAVTFADGATTAAPARIEAFDRDPLFLRYFFPYWTPWQQIYRMEFPLPVSTAAGALKLQGPAGKIRLRW